MYPGESVLGNTHVFIKLFWCINIGGCDCIPSKATAETIVTDSVTPLLMIFIVRYFLSKIFLRILIRIFFSVIFVVILFVPYMFLKLYLLLELTYPCVITEYCKKICFTIWKYSFQG